MNKEYVMKDFRLANAKEIDCKKYVESFMSRDKEVDYFTGSTSNFESKTIENYYLNSLEDSSRYDFLIWSNDKVIGEVVLNEIDLIVMSAHFRGIGKFATKSILDFAFNDLILKRVGLEVFDYNKRAIKLYEKVGFQREGRLRNAMIHEGNYSDIILMSMLTDEYESSK